MKFIFGLLLLVISQMTNAAPVQPKPEPTYALWDIDRGELLADNNSDKVRPVASITKLMSALVVLSSDLDMDEVLTVKGKEASSYIRNGMQISREHLLSLSLISSDNLAARTLAETYPGGYRNFLERMNSMAQSLGMSDTHYDDATGLEAGNVSTAYDLYKLVLAVSNFSVILNAANTASLQFHALIPKPKKVQSVQIRGRTTNWYTGKLNLLAAKTGFTSKAGRCLTMLFNKNGTNYLVVVMGLPNPIERKKLVDSLIDSIK